VLESPSRRTDKEALIEVNRKVKDATPGRTLLFNMDERRQGDVAKSENCRIFLLDIGKISQITWNMPVWCVNERNMFYYHPPPPPSSSSSSSSSSSYREGVMLVKISFVSVGTYCCLIKGMLNLFQIEIIYTCLIQI